MRSSRNQSAIAGLAAGAALIASAVVPLQASAAVNGYLAFTEYATASSPYDIVTGPDGYLWWTDYGTTSCKPTPPPECAQHLHLHRVSEHGHCDRLGSKPVGGLLPVRPAAPSHDGRRDHIVSIEARLAVMRRSS